MARRGTTKVIHGLHGRTTIQEELDGQVRVFTPDAWAAELARRDAEESIGPAGDDADENVSAPLSYADLKAKAKELGLSQAGNTEVLRARIAEHLALVPEVEITNDGEGDHPLVQEDDEQDD